VKFPAERARAVECLGTPVHVIPNGVPLPNSVAASAARRNGTLVIGTAARISPQKQLEELIDAVRIAHARLPPFVLRIAGGVETGAEDYARKLNEQAQGLPMEWVGELPDMGEFLRGLDLFAMISAPAGCPNATLEALAAGLAVVATDVGGAREQIVDGQTGLLSPAGDPAALAERIVELVKSSELRSQLALRGREHIRRHFSLDRMVSEYCRVCLGIADVVNPIPSR